jgi:hypothetical protein
MKDVPINTWMVVEAADTRIAAISMHGCQQEAERERDRHNQGLPHKRFKACIAVEPIADRMGRSCR